MKMVLILVCFLGFVILGVIIKSKFQRKEKLLSNFISFCETAKTQISFLQTNLEKLVEIEIKKTSGEFAEILKAFLKNLKENAPLVKPEFVAEDEWEIICSMLNGLGRSNVENQIALCENVKCAITPSFATAQTKNRNEGNMWLKLMLCLAFMSLIILI